MSALGDGEMLQVPSVDAPSHDQPDVASMSAPATEGANDATASTNANNHTNNAPVSTSASRFNLPTFSPATEEILKRVTTNTTLGTPGWEAAREAVLKNMATSDKIPTPPPRDAPSRRGRGGKKPSPLSNGINAPPETPIAAVKEEAIETPGPVSVPSTGRGRGRGRGRASLRGSASVRGLGSARGLGRGRGRGRGGGRGGRRKSDGDDVIKVEDAGDSDSSENYTPLATATRSGRSVQKPEAFVPVIPSPTQGQKRKRNFGRRNPELTVCKLCLRPHSPATNMIVFCDDCNTPYHRYCHHPPIPQEVVDIADMEWHCSECKIQRGDPVDEPDVDSFVAAQVLTQAQKRQVLSLLPTQTLVTLLLRANSLRPDLPLYPPGSQKVPLPTTLPELLDDPRPRPNGRSPSDSDLQPYEIRPPDEPPFDVDDPAVNYPKQGYGLGRTLPPERDDLSWLVDDNYEVYSHVYQTDPQAANESLFPAEDRDETGSGDVTMAGAEAGSGAGSDAGS